MRSRILASISLIVGAVVVLSGTGAAFAQQTSGYSGGNGLKVSPVRTDLTIKPGQSQTVDIYVQNLTSTSADLQAIVNDFTADKNETGQPDLILNANQSAPTHGLKQFVQPVATFSLAPNEQKDIKITVKIPAGTHGGGYYGAVRFAPVSATSNKNVTLSASVGSLILVTVPGQISENVTLAGYEVAQRNNTGMFFTNNKNLSTQIRFQNTGDLQEEPFGNLILKKGSKVLATYQVNSTEPRGNVLPDSIRRFDVKLDKVGSLGKYTVQGNFGYGSKGQLLTASKTFYIIPVPIILLGLLILLVIVFFIFVFPRMVKSYNRRVVQKANGGKAPKAKVSKR